MPYIQGTLIYNSLSFVKPLIMFLELKLDRDIFPYLRFVGVIEWKDFRDRITKCEKRMPKLACRRAQVRIIPA